MYPITLNRSPVEVLEAGWYPVGLQTGLQPFHLLELRNDGATVTDAVWYLSQELDFVANSPSRFSQDQAELVVSSLSPLLRSLYDETLCAPRPEVAPSSHAFDGINPLFIREMISFVVDTALTPPDVVMADRLDGVSSHYIANGTRLSASLLRHSLDVSVPVDGKLLMPSPVNATLLQVQEHLTLADGLVEQVYRFCDPSGNLALYLLFQSGGTSPVLYIPIMNTAFATDGGLTGAQIMASLLSYYAAHADRAVTSLEPAHLAAAASEDSTADGTAPDANSPDSGTPGHAEPTPAAKPAAGATPSGDARTADTRAAYAEEAPEPAAASHASWWKRLFGLGSR